MIYYDRRVLILANFVVTIGRRMGINGDLYIQVVKIISTSISSCKTNSHRSEMLIWVHWYDVHVHCKSIIHACCSVLQLFTSYSFCIWVKLRKIIGLQKAKIPYCIISCSEINTTYHFSKFWNKDTILLCFRNFLKVLMI